ncbi:hypothetical protein ZHAS_00011809 [Anopheles sinensis]|uniref:C2H2-type domain-containing protein n=1 Tax=Anopheles sinensis TaxID=74873 RepID=A0A084W171_ANOSI|nr:hypothetical protein ZHAS_00011809 [Anopheles sinensis]
MIQLPDGGQNQQIPDVTDKDSCSGGVPFTTTNPQATSTPSAKVQELQQATNDTQGDGAEKPHPKNRRTSSRRFAVGSGRSDDEPSTSTSSTACCLAIASSSPVCDDESRTFKMPSVMGPSESRIICRLPLDRLETILSSLDIAKRSINGATDNSPVDTVLDLKKSLPTDGRGSTATSSVTQQSNEIQLAQDEYGPLYKLLCLYCERTFSNQKLMFKHTDRVHKLSKDRRSSSRVVSTANVADVSLCCNFCYKGRTLKPSSDDLPQLFKHLVTHHSDRYYACEQCILRFPCEEAREAHMEAIHPATNGARPKSKAALKAFSHNRNKTTNYSLTLPSSATVKSSKSAKKKSATPDTCAFDTEATLQNYTTNDDRNERDQPADTETSAGTGGQSARLRSSPRNTVAPLHSRGDGKTKMKTLVFKKSERLLMRNAEPMLLSRLGIAQHRLPRQSRRLLAIASSCARGRASSRKKHIALSLEESLKVDNCVIKVTKLKSIRSSVTTGGNNNCSIMSNTTASTASSVSSVGLFDVDFYENVTRNVNINLSCFLDGKLQLSPSDMPSPSVSAVNAAVPTVRSIVVRSPAVTDSKIYEATDLPVGGGVMFPTLLTVEQYGTDVGPGQSSMATSSAKAKKPITKNSWKWKWDFVKKYKYVNENGRIVKKIKQPTLGLRDLSKLDMWTQLTMRMKYEEVRKSILPNERDDVPKEECVAVLRQDKQAMVNQLDQILDARLLPQIDLEQNDQRIIKVEPADEQPSIDSGNESSKSLIPLPSGNEEGVTLPHTDMDLGQAFLQGLKLMKLVQHNNLLPVVLSGEWARPRCYICYGCGDKFNSLKQVEEHRIFRHPHVYSTFYEIVGRELIEKRLYKHFFIPYSALAAHRLHYLRLAEPEFEPETGSVPYTDGTYNSMNIEIKNEDSSSNEATSVSTTTSAALASSSRSSISSNSITTLATLMDASADCVTSLTRYPPALAEDEGESSTVVCSKCKKECQNMLVLYAHMLHCSNDYVWLQAKKRMKYRRARRRRGGNRNTSGTVGGLSCAASLLATVRKAQQNLQHSVEKSETASTSSTSSSKEGGLSIDLNNSSNTSTASTSNGSIGSISHSPSNKKKSKSPKPKDTDSDIVKRLLANLPAKRNSRQIILQTAKQLGKRSNVKGRIPLVAPSKASKCVGLKSRHTLGTVAPRIASPKETKKVSVASRLAAGSLPTTKADKQPIRDGATSATPSDTSTAASSRNLRSTSADHSRSPQREENGTVSGSTRSKWTSAKVQKNLISKQKEKRSQKGKLVKEVEGEKKKVQQWKKTSRQFRRITASGKRILRSGCSREKPVSGRKPQLRKKALPGRKGKLKKSITSSQTGSGSKSVDKDVETPKALCSDQERENFQEDSTHEESSIRSIRTDEFDVEKTKDIEKTNTDHNDTHMSEERSSNVETFTETTPHNDNVSEHPALVDGGEIVEHEDGTVHDLNKQTSSIASVDAKGIEQLQAEAEDIKEVSDTLEQFKAPSNQEEVASEVETIHPESLCQTEAHDSSSLAPSDKVQNDTDVVDMVASSSSSVNNCPYNRSLLDSSSQSPASKRKPKKLNDCIAMLTGKLSERLGVDFFNSQSQRKNSDSVEQTSQTTSEKHTSKTPAPVSGSLQVEEPSTQESPHSKHEFVMVPCKNQPEVTASPVQHSLHEKLPVPMNPKSSVIATPQSDDIPGQKLKLDTQNPPQMAPVSLVVNHLRSAVNHSEGRMPSLRESVAIPPSTSVSAHEIEDHLSDEPLNLSKTCRDRRNTYNTSLTPMGSQLHQQQPFHAQQQHQPYQQQQYQPGSRPGSPVLHSAESHLQQHNHRMQPAPSHSQKYLPPNMVPNLLHPNPLRNSLAADQTESNTGSSCTITPKPGSGNLSSIKLPPGLIIERVEYKQSRPIISKEAPSVTIVARHRQLPHSVNSHSEEATESRKSGATVTMPSLGAGFSTPPFAHSLSMADPQPPTSMQQHYCSGREHTKKVFDGCGSSGTSGAHTSNNLPITADQMASNNVRVLPAAEKPTQTVVPFVENRISVTITEAKPPPPDRLQDVRIRPRNNSSSASCSLPSASHPQPFKSQRNDKALPSISFSAKAQPASPAPSVLLPTQQAVAKVPSFRHQQVPQNLSSVGVPNSPEKPHHTTLIIPHVPMPHHAPPSQVTGNATKRGRRKSIFVSSPVVTDGCPSVPELTGSSSRETKKITAANSTTDSSIQSLRSILAPTQSSFAPTADSLCRANMLASMSFSLLPPGLLGGPASMGLDLQRLAAVGLPAHLKPPVIPPLTVPVSTASASSSATLLEKILQPTRNEALTNALEQSLKSAQASSSKPSSEQQLLGSDNTPPVSFLCSQNTENIQLGQPNSDAAVTGIPFAHVQATTTSSSRTAMKTPEEKSSGGRSKKSSSSGRSAKRTCSLGDFDRKTLMEQIWNASIVDAMMEKDAKLEGSRLLLQSTIPTPQQYRCSGLTGAEKSLGPLPAVESALACGVDLCVPRTTLSRIVCNTPEEKASSNEPHSHQSNQSLLNEPKEHDSSRKPPYEERLREQNDQPSANNKLPSQEEKVDRQKAFELPALLEPSDLTVISRTPDHSAQAGEDETGKSQAERLFEKESDKIYPNEPKSSVDMANTVQRAGELNNVEQADQTPEQDCPKLAADANVTPGDSTDTAKWDERRVQAESVTPTPKVVRKRRKNELASILSDQLLESFKEVDKSRLGDLKLLHDITCETPDVKFTLEQIPQLAKRKSNPPRMPELVSQSVSSSEKVTTLGAGSKKLGTNKRSPKEVNPTLEGREKADETCEMADADSTGDRNQEQALTLARPPSGQSDAVKESSTKQQHSSSSASFVPTRRTRKLSVDIERLRPAALAKMERMAQKNVSQKIAGHLDIAVPKAQKDPPVGRSAKGGGKVAQVKGKGSSSSMEDGSKQGTKIETAIAASGIIERKDTSNVTGTDLKTLPVEVPPVGIKQTKDGKLSKQKSKEQTPAPIMPAGGDAADTRGGVLEHQDTSVRGVPETVSQLTDKKSTPTVATPIIKRERRKSVFVDRNMAKYVERDKEHEDQLHSAGNKQASKDDLSLTLRRGMRSQDKTEPIKMDSFVETSMNPRDPRRRIVQKRMEQERAAAAASSVNKPCNIEEKLETLQNSTGDDMAQKENIQDPGKKVVNTNSANPAKKISISASAVQQQPPTKLEDSKAPAVRRISARRASVFVRSPTPPPPPSLAQPASAAADKNTADGQSGDKGKSKEDEHLRTIGNETRRIYRRRASIYQVPVEMLQQDDADDFESREAEPEKKRKPAGQQGNTNRRSKTPGPGDWNRRGQIRLNGKPEPTIESLLLQATNSSDSSNALNGPKRRTTKNSQIAETVSKLFNIQEEIMLIDSSRRKPKKANTAPLSSSSTPAQPSLPLVVNIPEESANAAGVLQQEHERLPSAQHQPGELTIVAAAGPEEGNICNSKDNQQQQHQQSPLPASSPPATLPLPPPPPRKSISFSNDDEDDSPKVINELVENILKNAHESDSSNDSEDDNMSLACFVAQKSVAEGGVRRRRGEDDGGVHLDEDDGLMASMYIPVRAMSVAGDDDDGSTTYTDGMDDDLMSVTTELAPSTGGGNMYGGRGGRRKRRQLAPRGSKLKRQQQAKAKAAQAQSDDKHSVTYNCELCRKVFKKQDAFNKHRMTLTHIAKLSEQEYIQSQQKQQQQQQQQQRDEQPKTHDQKNNEQDKSHPLAEGQPAAVGSSNSLSSESASPSAAVASSLLLTYPREMESAGVETASPQPKDQDKNALKVLSQEEKLFYECCSMLKESNATEGDNMSVTVSLKTNEMDDAPGSAAISMLSVPVEGDDKFADVRYPLPYLGRTVVPTIVEPLEPRYTLPLESAKDAPCCPKEEGVTPEKANFQSFRDVVVCHGEGGKVQHRPNVVVAVAESYGDISPQNSTKSSSTTSSSSSSNSSNAKIKTKGALKGYDNFKVSIPMTGLIMTTNTGGVAPEDIDGIGASSIGSNAKESRLDTLADVALCGDIPIEFGVLGQYDRKLQEPSGTHIECTSLTTVQPSSASMVNSKINPKKLAENKDDDGKDTKEASTASILDPEANAQTYAGEMDSCKSEVACKSTELGTKNHSTTSYRSTPSTGRSRSVSRKRKKIEPKPKQTVTKGGGTGVQLAAKRLEPPTGHHHKSPDDDDDVYAFQDSPSDDALPGTYTSRKSHDHPVSSMGSGREGGIHQQHRAQKHEASPAARREDEEESQVSSLSFSDRDDFVYGTNTMSDEDEEEEEEEGKSSSNSSGQTTPKKKTKADVQKKSLIMGRIFKKGGKKEKAKESVEAVTTMKAGGMLQSSSVDTKLSILDPSALASAKAAPPAKDFDKLFDTLKNATTPPEVRVETDRVKRSSSEKCHGETFEEHPNSSFEAKSDHEQLTDSATAPSRLRRTATVRQKKLTETWDSDEYEEFHSDDIMGLIDRVDDGEANDGDKPMANNNGPVGVDGAEPRSVSIPYIFGLSLKSHIDRAEGGNKQHIDETLEPPGGELAANKQPPPTLDVVVTDDTIRKVMESVILETMVKGSSQKGALASSGNHRKTSNKSHKLTNNGRGNGNHGVSASSGNYSATIGPKKKVDTLQSDADVTQALEEHVLESSVVISSQTITTKFKQKLNISKRSSTPSSSEGASSMVEGSNSKTSSKKPKPSPALIRDPMLVPDNDSAPVNVNSLAANNNNNIHNNNNNNHSNKHNTNKVKASTTSSNPFKPSPTAGLKGRAPSESSCVVGAKAPAGRGRPPLSSTTGPGASSVTTASRQKKAAPRRMKNVAYDPDSDYEHSIKYKKVKRKLLESDIEANLKIEQLQSSLSPDGGSMMLPTTTRRKRNAGDMLYYWSSSSDEEEAASEIEDGYVSCEATGKRKKKRSSDARGNNKATAMEKQTGVGRKPRSKAPKPTGGSEFPLAESFDGGKTTGAGVSSAHGPKQHTDAVPSGGGKSKQNSTKPNAHPSIFESSGGTVLVTISTTDEAANDAGTSGKNGRGRKQQQQQQQSNQGKPTSGSDAVADTTSNNSNENLQQHGWIVGDSHKKLVTLLAHAKGKQERKTTNHRRK